MKTVFHHTGAGCRVMIALCSHDAIFLGTAVVGTSELVLPRCRREVFME